MLYVVLYAGCSVTVFEVNTWLQSFGTPKNWWDFFLNLSPYSFFVLPNSLIACTKKIQKNAMLVVTRNSKHNTINPSYSSPSNGRHFNTCLRQSICVHHSLQNRSHHMESLLNLFSAITFITIYNSTRMSKKTCVTVLCHGKGMWQLGHELVEKHNITLQC